MRWLWIFASTYLLFVLQTGFARHLEIVGYAPHLVLAGIFCLAVRMPGRGGLVVAAGWGLVSDCLTDGRLGPDLVTFVLAAHFIQQLSCRWNLETPGRAGVLSAAIIWAVLVVSTALRTLPDGHIPNLAALARSAAGTAIYTSLLVAAATLAARLVRRSTNGSDTVPVATVSNQWRMLAE
jgi:rod shape-determining protein MreD